MTITTADAIQIMGLVALLHRKTAPRVDDHDVVMAAAQEQAKLYNAYNFTLDEILDAIRFRARTESEAPEPADIIAVARQRRHERFLSQPIEAQNAHAELRDAARAHLLYEAEPALALTPSPKTPESVMATPEYTHCPTCGARAGLPCRNNQTGMTFTNGYHMARESAAAIAAAEKRRALTPPEPRTLFCGECGAAPGEACTSGGMQMRDVHPERRPA